MKLKYSIVILGAVAIIASSCEKFDNYDEPDTFFTGSIVYNDQVIQVGTDQVRFQLWQPEFAKDIPIDVAIDQDGTFTARLFKGEYKLAFVQGQGPFTHQQDTVLVNLDGDKEMNIDVLPYYTIGNAQINKEGNNITASCSLNQIVTGDNAKDVENVTLFLGFTEHISNEDRPTASSDAPEGLDNPTSMDADISNLNAINVSIPIPNQEYLQPKIIRNYIYARIGVKMVGVEDMIYSQVEKIDL